MSACVDSSRNQTSTSPFSSSASSRCHISNSRCKLLKKCTPTVSNLVSGDTIHPHVQKSNKPSKISPADGDGDDEEDHMWVSIQEEALSDIKQEPILSKYYFSSVLSHASLESVLANQLAIKLGHADLSSDTLYDFFLSVLTDDTEIQGAIREDLKAVKERDPACISYVHCLLNFKGFLACQAHRVAHKFWSQGRTVVALLIQNRVSEVFGVDIHPGANIGRGILFDHATGIVIGETAVVGNGVSILHNVTLGGTGKVSGDRHPKIGDGVMIGAGAKVLGNVKVGEGATIGAGSVVLKEVPPKTTAVGNPARLVGGKK